MHKIKFLTIAIIFILSLVLTGQSVDVSARSLGATSPTLGAVGSYSVLAGSIVTNTGATTMPGNMGISPGIGPLPHFTGFPPGVAGPPGVIHDADSSAAAAQAANTAVFAALSAAPNVACNAAYATGTGAVNLSGATLTPDVYCADAFELTGPLPLYLNALGDPDAVWIFRSELSTLATTPGVGASVQFLDGVGSACNVWWKVASSASIGSGSVFIGNILALTSISLGTGASLDGRALAQTGAVTLDNNTITGVVCLTADVTPRRRVAGLPDSGGAPIRNQDLPWSLLVIGGICAIALVFGVRQYRIARRSK